MMVVLGQAMAGSDLGYANQTTIHPLGLLAVVVLGTAMLLAPRRLAVVPMLIMACSVASAQRFVVAGLDFNLLRVMVLFGTMRVVWRKEYLGFLWQPIDFVIVLYAAVKAATYSMQLASLQALVTQLGQSYDAVGMYFLFRCLVREWGDVRALALAVSWLLLPVVTVFLIERATGRNMFSVFGGVPEKTLIRDGRLRCQGPFGHAILAGCFFAALLPILVAQWWDERVRRWLIIAASVSVLAIIVSCASSTPVVALLASLFAVPMFALRKRLAWVRWGTIAMLIALHFSMNAPVWHLVSRIDMIGGSTGYHRYKLIDAAIRHFEEWAPIGIPSTLHWGAGLHDLTNQYVLEGVRGGVLTLVLFVTALWLAFASAGRLVRCASNRSELVMAWALGASLFVHATSFIAVSYFGQITMLWWLSLAIPVSLVASRKSNPSGRFNTHYQLQYARPNVGMPAFRV